MDEPRETSLWHIEAEQSVLGAMMLDPEAVAVAADILHANDFYHAPHRIVFEVLCRLDHEGVPVDFVTLNERLDREGQLAECGGVTYITTLSASVPMTANIGRYCAIVRDRAKIRQIRAQCLSVAEACEAGDGTPDEYQAQLLQLVEQQRRAGADAGAQPILEVARSYIDHIERVRLGQAVSTYPTGVTSLDRWLGGGLIAGALHVIGGWSGVGKTTLAMQVVVNQPPRVQTLVSSLEMQPHYLMAQLVAFRSGLSVDGVRAQLSRGHTWSQRDEQRHTEALDDLVVGGIHIGGLDKTDIDDLTAEAYRIKAAQGLHVWIVDHCQQVTSRRMGREGRRIMILGVVKALGQFARQTGCCVVLASQCRKKSPDRSEAAPPVLDDLEESGAIRQEATSVTLLHRWMDERGDEKLTAHLAKNRFGVPGTTDLRQDRNTLRFGDLSDRTDAPPDYLAVL